MLINVNMLPAMNLTKPNMQRQYEQGPGDADQESRRETQAHEGRGVRSFYDPEKIIFLKNAAGYTPGPPQEREGPGTDAGPAEKPTRKTGRPV